MKKNLLPVIFFLLPLTFHLSPVTCLAAIPEDYYSSIDGKTGDAIWETLYNRIKSHTDVGYDGLYDVYPESDVIPGTNQVWDIYSTCDWTHGSKVCGNYQTVCGCYNREHTVPQSWWSGSGMKSDAFHVMPTDGKVNGQRSNYPYGECAKGESSGDKALGRLGSSTFAGYSGKVFEPVDEYKGDIARNYFYMITCYMKQSFTQSREGQVMFTKENDHAAFTAYSLALLLKWHRQDPVSQKEIDRNNAIYKHQHNRNPYIDYPCLAEYIWGEHKGDKLDLSAIMSSENEKFLDPEYNSGCNCKTDAPTILYPKQSTTVSVGSASVHQSITRPILVQGVNLTNSLSLSLSGTNAACFSLNKTTISADDAMDGDTLLITYTPNSTTPSAPHEAKLTIHTSDIATDRVVTLQGESKSELVTPLANAEYRLDVEGVGTTTTIRIFVKGTNLTRGVNIDFNTGSPAAFSLSPTSLTADQVNAGDTVIVTYSPTAIGEESATIHINQSGSNPEFVQRFVTMKGVCAFRVNEPTDISSSSATLHWTNAATNNYMVDVFFLKTIEQPEVVILNSNKGENASKAGYTTTSGDYIRLGSGSNTGSLTYSGLDLTKASTLTITAKAYTGDADVPCRVTVNGLDTILSIGASDAQYVIALPANPSATSSALRIATTTNGKRAMIKNVKVVTGGTKEEREHVDTYPREENFLSHTVTGLLPETEYSYTITPDGLPESEIATFTTASTPTGLDSNHQSLHPTPYTKFQKNGHLYLRHNGQLYNVLGQPSNP